jgi:hypothetical protein
MDVAFSSAPLAALCSSGRRLSERWGPSLGRTIARRLLDLAAADAATLDRLPGATVSTNGTGEITIHFSADIVIRGIISTPRADGGATWADDDHILITDLDVHGSDR